MYLFQAYILCSRLKNEDNVDLNRTIPLPKKLNDFKENFLKNWEYLHLHADDVSDVYIETEIRLECSNTIFLEIT